MKTEHCLFDGLSLLSRGCAFIAQRPSPAPSPLIKTGQHNSFHPMAYYRALCMPCQLWLVRSRGGEDALTGSDRSREEAGSCPSPLSTRSQRARQSFQSSVSPGSCWLHIFWDFFFSLSEPIGKFSQGELKQCCLIRMVYFIGDRNRNIPSSNTEDKRKTKEGRAEVSQNAGYTRIR